MAARAAQQMPAPSGMSQMPGQMYLARAPSQVSIANQDEVASYLYNQGTPRPFLDAERQYTQSQVAYARQQVKKSPVNHVGISPAQGGEPSPLSITQSPSIYQSGFDFGINGTPTSARSKKSKQALSLVVDIDNVVDGPDVIPNRAAPTKRKQTKKVTPKGGAGLGKGKGGKGGKGRASICEAIGDTPPSATPAYNATASPIGQSNELFGGVSSAPQSGQSMTFQLPTTKLESRLPDRYDGEPQRAQQEQRDPMSYRSETAKHHDQQGSMQFQHHPNLHLQAQANGHPTQQSGMQQDPLSASQHDQAEADHDPQMTEDFLKALNEFGNESASGQHPPVSAFQGNFDEPAFDFDVSLSPVLQNSYADQ